MTTQRELAMLRLAAQRIVGARFASAAEAVGWMTATQAQDFPGALLSVALRLRDPSRAAVTDALDSGAVIRSWPMRGTLHLVLADDLRWMLALTAPRMLDAARTRRAELGIDDDVIDQARTLALDHLGGGRRLSRDALLQVWREAGLLSVKERGYHLLAHLAISGLLCHGPVLAGAQQLVLLSEWVQTPRRLEREESLGEWALRYFRSHGPATVRDFAWWTKLLAADVKVGVTLALPQLERLVVQDVEYLMDPLTPTLLDAHRAQARATLLLPGFDEYLLGYQDRSAALPREFADRVVPGGNGVFRPTVVSAGEVVGTWRPARRPTGSTPDIAATPFTRFASRTARALPRLYAALP